MIQCEAIEVKNLALRRGGRRLFSNLSWSISAGQILQLQGQNGCGKTSLLRCIAGLLPAESGTIVFNPPSEPDGFDRRTLIGWLGIEHGFKPQETVFQQCVFASQLGRNPMTRPELTKFIDRSLDQMGIAQLSPTRLHKLSRGQRQRLALTHLMLRPARLWLLDEPTLGLDLAGEEIFTGLIGNFCLSGGMVVLASHHRLPPSLPVTILQLDAIPTTA
ncbi:MAG: heme ABC exporter ATP-binding protein CcmA [Alphaproteobacteria bacterium]|nr:heme ABC exporter ATP-binding protein CcmA [Alphaproteobacteria bacterium]